MPWDEEGAAERPVRRGWCGSPANPPVPSRAGRPPRWATAAVMGSQQRAPRARVRESALPTARLRSLALGREADAVVRRHARGRRRPHQGALPPRPGARAAWQRPPRPRHEGQHAAALHVERADKASPSAGSTSPAPQRTRTNAPGRGRAHPVLLCAFLDRTLSPSFPSSCTLSPPSAARFSFPSSCTSSKHRPLRSARWRRRCWRSSWGR